MQIIPQQIKARFAQLAADANQIPMRGDSSDRYSDGPEFHTWASSALSIVQAVFGKTSPHFDHLNAAINIAKGSYITERQLNGCRGAFLGAKNDVDGDFVFKLEAQFAGEVFGDFISAAKAALTENRHHVAAVLACAALEDALKRFAEMNEIDTSDKTMEDVINALKSKGLVGGAQKSLLAAMPKIRNSAMHAEWEKLTPEQAGSVIGFTEQFLLTNF